MEQELKLLIEAIELEDRIDQKFAIGDFRIFLLTELARERRKRRQLRAKKRITPVN